MPSKTRPDERPELTRERNVEAGVRDTFPASDPVSSTTAQGSRAVPPQEMMQQGGSKPAAAVAPVTFSVRFPNQESAKLALETLVREGPIDRRCAELAAEGDGATLKVTAAGAEAERFKELLHRAAR